MSCPPVTVGGIELDLIMARWVWRKLGSREWRPVPNGSSMSAWWTRAIEEAIVRRRGVTYGREVVGPAFRAEWARDKARKLPRLRRAAD